MQQNKQFRKKTKYQVGWRVFTILGIILILAACNSTNENQNDADDESNNVNQEQMDDGQTEERFEPHELASLMKERAYERVHRQASAEFQNEIDLASFSQVADSALAEVTSFHSKSHFKLNGAQHLSWTDDTEQLGLQALFDEDDTILTLLIQPLISYPDTDENFTETEFILPFKGEWFVYWGGTNVMENYHYALPMQRYAYDFLRVQDEFSFAGDQTKNESYYAYGEEVIAPAAGKIVKVIDEIDDNTPFGEMNPMQPTGNYVVIDHGNDEFSHLAHFQKGSITVHEGDQVEAGDLLGLSGNSGNSSEAHIHFQVSDGPEMEQSTSLRIRFKEDAGLQPEGYVQGQTAAHRK